MIRSLVLASTLALSLAACGPAGFGSSNDDDGVSAPDPAPEVDMLPADGFEADIVIVPTEDIVASLYGVNDLTATYDAEEETVTLSGTTEIGNSGGRTTGASFMVDEATVAELAGKTVTVRVLAKGAEGTSLNVAYSTASVGNSGWQTFELGDSFAEYSFDYSINPNDANADFIGFIPEGGDVTIAAIGLDTPDT